MPGLELVSVSKRYSTGQRAVDRVSLAVDAGRLLVLFLCLQVGFLVLTSVLGARLSGELPMWSVVVANLLAAAGMMGYQWRRHPGVVRRADRLWEDS